MNAVEVKPSRTRGFDLRREGAGGAGWAGAGRTPSSRSDAYPGGFTGALFPDVLASAKSSRHFASMAPVSRYAIGAMKIGEAPRNRAEIGVAPRCPEPTLGDRGRSLGLAACSRTSRRGERAALARSCSRRAEVCGAPRRMRSFSSWLPLSRARLDGTKTRRVGARRVSFVCTRAVGPTFDAC